MADGSRPRACRIGNFVLDLSACELRHHGRSLKVERQPMELLMLLVARHGELVTRDEIVEHLWDLDVDTRVNTVIRKIRRVLRDSADAPRFLQTVQGKGYRFIVDLEPPTVAVLAVLPFENLTRDAAEDYVADGITEETIVSLGQAAPDHLCVIGRTSCMAYRGTKKCRSKSPLNCRYSAGSLAPGPPYSRITAGRSTSRPRNQSRCGTPPMT
jgi:DNA-binding winged helix-turn-helix (wHTH) protein